MVKVLNMKIESIEGDKRKVVATLVADTAAEVNACGTSGANIIGLMKDDTLVLGSMAMCVDGAFGLLGSSGTWSW